MKHKEKSEVIADWIKRRRKHHKKWPEPLHAEVIFDLHFAVHSHARGVFHAEVTIELPVSDTKSEFYTISATSKTQAGALRSVIQQLESAKWYHYFRFRGARFRVTGVMEGVYRGWL